MAGVSWQAICTRTGRTHGSQAQEMLCRRTRYCHCDDGRMLAIEPTGRQRTDRGNCNHARRTAPTRYRQDRLWAHLQGCDGLEQRRPDHPPLAERAPGIQEPRGQSGHVGGCGRLTQPAPVPPLYLLNRQRAAGDLQGNHSRPSPPLERPHARRHAHAGPALEPKPREHDDVARTDRSGTHGGHRFIRSAEDTRAA